MSVAYLKSHKDIAILGTLVLTGIAIFVLVFSLRLFSSGSGTDNAEDGFYLGELGYDSPPFDLQKQCPLNYSLLAKIEQKVLMFDDELFSFVAPLSVNMEIKVDRTDLIPVSDTAFSIVGTIENATINSEICGTGYFKLTKQL